MMSAFATALVALVKYPADLVSLAAVVSAAVLAFVANVYAASISSFAAPLS